MEKAEHRLELLHVLVILIFTIKYLISSVTDIIPYTVFLALALLYFVFCFFLASRSVRWTMFKIAVLILLLSFLYYFFTITSSVSTSVSYYNLKRFFAKFNQLVNFFFPLLLLSNFVKLRKTGYQNVIFLVALIAFSYVVIHSFIIFTSGEESARVWASFSELESENVATYIFVYAASSFVPVVFAFQQKHKKIVFRIIAIAYIILLYAFLFSAQYTLALFIPTVCIFIALLKNGAGAKRIVLLLLLLAVLAATPLLLSWLADIVSSDTIRSRLLSILKFIRGETGGANNLTGRLELYQKCFQYFFKSPIIGNQTVPFDGHATFLTVLCDLGLMGTIPTYILYFGSHRVVRAALKDQQAYSLWIPCFIGMILMGFTNPVHSASVLGYAVYFMGPALLKMRTDGEKKEHEQI